MKVPRHHSALHRKGRQTKAYVQKLCAFPKKGLSQPSRDPYKYMSSIKLDIAKPYLMFHKLSNWGILLRHFTANFQNAFLFLHLKMLSFTLPIFRFHAISLFHFIHTKRSYLALVAPDHCSIKSQQLPKILEAERNTGASKLRMTDSYSMRTVSHNVLFEKSAFRVT